MPIISFIPLPTIKKITTYPSLASSLTYNGAEQTPTWNNYDSTQMTIGGTTKATNAGSYTTTFTPNKGYSWADGSTDAYSINWSIAKAAGSSNISKTSISLTYSTKSATFTVTRSGDGTITATSSNTSVATVSKSGTTITVTAKGSGTATITVKVAAGTNHTAPSNKTCSVVVNLIPSFEDISWAEVSTISKSGKASSYWSVGESKSFSFAGNPTTCLIVGFDHDNVENSNSYGRTKAGITVAFFPYDDNGALKSIYSTYSSYGWSRSTIRTNCASLMSSLPSELQSVIVPVLKISKKGYAYGEYATEITTDSLFCASAVEWCGDNVYGEEGSQYSYYANGNYFSKAHNWSRTAAASGSGHAWVLQYSDNQLGATVAQMYNSLLYFPHFCI